MTLAVASLYLGLSRLSAGERAILGVVIARCTTAGSFETAVKLADIARATALDPEGGYFKRSARKLRTLGVLTIDRHGPRGVVARLDVAKMRLLVGECAVEVAEYRPSCEAGIALEENRPSSEAGIPENRPSQEAAFNTGPFPPSSSTTLKLEEKEEEGGKGPVSEGPVFDTALVIRAMLAGAPTLLAWADAAATRRYALLTEYVQAFHDANRAPDALIRRLEYWLTEGHGAGPLAPELLESRLLDLASEHYPVDGRRIDAFLRGAAARFQRARGADHPSDFNAKRGSVVASYRARLAILPATPTTSTGTDD